MIRVRKYGEVTDFCMGRTIGPVVPYAVHAFLIGDTLIDTGTVYAQEEFLDALKGSSLSTIINTHHHEDHIGNNLALHNAFGASIHAHEKALPFLADPKAIGLKAYQRIVWGLPEKSQGQALDSRISCAGRTFDVIYTPGHSPDHVCLFNPDTGWLFTGDIFCGRTVRYLRRDEDFSLTLSSLKRLAELDVTTLFCSLKGIVEDGKAALEAKISFMERLAAEVLELKESGYPPCRIRRKILGREDAMYYLSTAHFSKEHVIESILFPAAGCPSD
ncbi:MAG TPA: MBL fold metallo-hydrolase [Deltaproteobacteria bacterium]|nr:MBL fold metallo-hydrolase [Deltaproteobacteria bacterium]HQI00376.1 MBL fold metallo-hydrolase [Deltaproteobacteria bacterium]